jgi:hypothetical protein
MGRRGDSSAAAALRRVTGVTVVGGRYVYVRGLGPPLSFGFQRDQSMNLPLLQSSQAYSSVTLPLTMPTESEGGGEHE